MEHNNIPTPIHSPVILAHTFVDWMLSKEQKGLHITKSEWTCLIFLLVTFRTGETVMLDTGYSTDVWSKDSWTKLGPPPSNSSYQLNLMQSTFLGLLDSIVIIIAKMQGFVVFIRFPISTLSCLIRLRPHQTFQPLLRYYVPLQSLQHLLNLFPLLNNQHWNPFHAFITLSLSLPLSLHFFWFFPLTSISYPSILGAIEVRWTNILVH